MEYETNTELGFLEELLGLREMEYNINYADQDFDTMINSSNNGCWSLDSCFSDNNFPVAITATTNTNSNSNTTTSFQENYTLLPPLDHHHHHHHQILMNNSPSSYAAAFGDEQSPPEFTVDSSITNLDNTQTLPYYSLEDYYSMSSILGGDENGGALFENGVHQINLVDDGDVVGAPYCKVEPVLPEVATTSFNMGFCPKNNVAKAKKLGGQPSKNLMAERRRRKRLNDRLSMLRSVVPKISKMDRTSILGDTIDYMKELLERINSLQEEMHLGSKELSLMSIFKDAKPNEVLVRNSPKFEVERRKEDTRIEICCGGKAGLLVSTVTTLEALGFEIKQCVISCFNDFSLQASCSEELKKRAILDTEDIKQALLRNAGYGGRSCL